MKVSLCIPAYNGEKVIGDAIWSCLKQDYPDKEILIIDDCSSDNTFNCAKSFGTFVCVLKNEKNLGIGGNLTKCMQEAKGDYIIYLSQDDYFTHESVVGDMVSIFEMYPRVGVIGRSYYQFIDGYPGAVARCDGELLEDFANPSGVGYRNEAMVGEFSNRIFIENTVMAKRILDCGWHRYELDYDTVAVRLHPNNTCVISNYYNEPPVMAVRSIIPSYVNYQSFISVKNRAPKWLWAEIYNTGKWRSIVFWAYALMAVCTPRWLLIKLCNFYRHRIGRRFCVIKSRSGQKSKD